MRLLSRFCAVLVSLFVVAPASAGPYDTASGPGSLGIPATSPRLVGWATGVSSLVRGPQNISVPGSPPASFGVPANALGVANNTFVSLGDGGSITLTFAVPITNGPGADFAVFENGFQFGGVLFAELGHVEVSSNGTDFVRFPSVSLTPTGTQVGSFDGIDATDIHNLAGKHDGLGTPFDLADLTSNSLLDVLHVRFVRVVDVVGSVNPAFGTRDSLGNLINDPFPTAFASGGFDLDGVGVLNQAVPEPASVALLAAGAAALGLRRLRRRQVA